MQLQYPLIFDALQKQKCFIWGQDVFFALQDRLIANPNLGWAELLFSQSVDVNAADMRLNGYARREI